jgi:hypothetical protein
MFEKEVEKVIEQYISNSWYASTYRTESIQEDISKRVYHALPFSEEIVDNLVKYPSLYKELSDIVKQEFPLLHSCITFMRNERINTYSFRSILTDKNHRNEFSKAANALKLRVVQEELKPYANRLFNELPSLESRANDLFEKENQ